MNLRALIILLSIVGISATFMPWLYFPKSDSSLYGYVGDGIVSGIVFLIIFIVAFFRLGKPYFDKITIITISILSGLMALMSYFKLEKFEYDMVNFSTDNPLLAGAFAGVTQGIGIYIVGFSGIAILGICLTEIILHFSSHKRFDTNKNPIRHNKVLILIPFILLLFTGGYWYWKNHIGPSSSSKDELKLTLQHSVHEMGQALIIGDYDKFVKYNHLQMQQSMGGRENLIDLVKSTMEGLKVQGTTIQEINLDEILSSHKKGTTIQAIVTQKVILSDAKNTRTETQKLLAISEDNGKTWQFINISNKSKEHIKQNFPILMDELLF